MSSMIQFYEPDQPYGFLSNFSSHSICIDGVVWPTVEHFYQASKFTAADIIARVHHASTPGEAYNTSHKYNSQVRPDWSAIKDTVMLRGVRSKFDQYHQLSHWLVATEQQAIVEHSYTDQPFQGEYMIK